MPVAKKCKLKADVVNFYLDSGLGSDTGDEKEESLDGDGSEDEHKDDTTEMVG